MPATPTAAPMANGGAANIYVVQQPSPGMLQTGIGVVLEFSATANGVVAPIATLTPPAGMIVEAVATDSLGQVYVGGYLPSIGEEVLVYAAGASGQATPPRTIVADFAFGSIASMAVDSTGLLYVAAQNFI